MIELIGSNHNSDTDVYTFYYWNRDTNWYYKMHCRNSFGTADMNARCTTMNDEQFNKIAGDRIA